MHTMNRKEVLTTGEVAKICHVAPRTVSKWFDTGKLRGYRIPGSRDRRIPVEQLIAFMRAYGIPLLDGMDVGTYRILIMDSQVSSSRRELIRVLSEIDRYDVRLVANGFEAGVLAQQFRPHVIVIDTTVGEQEAVATCQNIRSHSELQSAKVIAAISDVSEPTRMHMIAQGFDDCIPETYSLDQLVQAIENAATDLVT